MASLIVSHRGLRAFFVLAISVLCFFAFQQLHQPVQDIGHQLASAHKVHHKHAAAPIQDAADQLAKRVAVPFGDAASCNFSSPPDEQPSTHPDLIKRANSWTLTYEAAVCKGKKLRDRIDASNTNGRIWSYSDMTTNGWTVTEPGLVPLPGPLRSAMDKYGISTAAGDNRQRNAMLDHPFVNDAGETVEQDSGYYENAYNVKSGAIIAINNASPAYCANYGVDPPHSAKTIETLVPPLNRWSDVIWTIWADTAGTLAPTLKYIFRDNVVNEDSKHVMDAVMGLPTTPDTGNLHLPFPGETFDLSDDRGCALLGTPHGVGIGWLLIDHTAALSGRKLKITVYTGVDETNGRNQYFLIFDMQ